MSSVLKSNTIPSRSSSLVINGLREQVKSFLILESNIPFTESSRAGKANAI